MGDSDEEEMRAMRSSSKYGGGRAPAPGAAPASPPQVAKAAPVVVKKSTYVRSSASGIVQPQITPDSDEEEEATSSRARQGRAQAQPRLPQKGSLGPQKPTAASAAAAAGYALEDSDEAMSAEEEPAEQRSFLPVTFGKVTGDNFQAKTKASVVAAADAGQRRDPKLTSPTKKSGVSFGPRAMDAAAIVGGASRRASASARAVEEAEAKARAEALEEEQEEERKRKAATGEDEEAVYGFAEAPPPPGTEHLVLPVTHEAIIPVHEKLVTAIGLDPKGSRMIAGSMDGHLKFYDFNGMSEAKESFRSLEPIEGHMIQDISFSTTGGCVLVVCSDAHARVYDRDGGSRAIQSTVKGDMYVRDMTHTNGHTQMLTGGQWHPFSPDEWCTSSLDGTLRLWSLKSKPVGMDQVLPSVHVLKCLDKRGVCVGGSCGRAGGLYPNCVSFAPTSSMVVGGCSEGSVQFFYEKARYNKPDKILRTAHTAMVSNVSFLGDGVGGNKLVTRSLDGSMKLWDCRMLSDAKGPVRTWDDLPTSHEKTGVCCSPDGKYIVTGTEPDRKTGGSSFVKIFNAETGSLEKKLDFGKRTVVGLTWQKDINQILVGTSAGEVVMLYSPFSSNKGALHFVGRHRRAKEGHEMEGESMGPIFCMTDPKEIQQFYQTGRGNVQSIRRNITRAEQKTVVPAKPAALDGKTATTVGTQLVSKVILALEGKSKYAEDDSQKALLAYAEKEKHNKIYMGAYGKDNPTILDYTVEDGAGDQKMQGALKGDFCRKCGQKICRCVDYTQYGSAFKKQKL